jgi:hypothetical protein
MSSLRPVRADPRGPMPRSPRQERTAEIQPAARPVLTLLQATLLLKESPAWRALPDRARRLLDRLELEYMRQGLTGDVRVSYDEFVEWDIDRRQIRLAILQCVLLGFLVVRQGYRAANGFKVRSTYRLTYVWGVGRDDLPTNDWHNIADDTQAAKALQRAKATFEAPAPSAS